MKTLCYALPLMLLAFLMTARAQQVALLNAPMPAPAVSSLLDPGTPSIMPVIAHPAARERETLARPDWSLLGAAAALRFLDYKSTVKALSDPANFREVELPQALVHNKPGFAAFETGTVVANYYVYRGLVRRHHRDLARLGQSINVGAVAWTVGHNYYGLETFWPRYNFLRQDDPPR